MTKSCARKRVQKRRIPTYAADGSRLRDYTLAAIEHLNQLAMVAVVRNRRGSIVTAQFRETDGGNPFRQNAMAGTRYSYIERIGEFHFWQHRPLIPRADLKTADATKEELDAYVRSIFLAVPLSTCSR